MNSKPVVIILEAIRDIDIVKPILEAAHFPLDKIQFVSASGKTRMLKLAKEFPDAESVILLMDSDAPTIPDAEKNLQKKYSEKGLKIVFAIPEIEAWIFADDKLLMQQNLNDNSRELVNRLSMPEEIAYPRLILSNVLKNKSNWDFLKTMNITKATSRSPSLRFFLKTIGEALHMDMSLVENSTAHNMDRKIFANLLKEVFYSDTVIYKTMTDGRQFTAKEILSSVEEGGEIGKQYTSDLLRIARDFLKRQAVR